jgi:hypothetical protein
MDDAIQRIMAAVFGPSLFKQYNWYGNKGKPACKDLRIAEVIFGAILLLYSNDPSINFLTNATLCIVCLL